MNFKEHFFKKAIETATNNHGVAPHHLVARQLLTTAMEFRSQSKKFTREIVRQTLNRWDVQDPSERKLYSSFIHAYFANIGADYAKKKASRSPKNTKKDSPKYKIIVENGSRQQAWIFTN